MKRVVILPLLLGVLYAGPVQFSGLASISGEYGWVTGSGDTLVEPRPELRFSLSPSLSFWGFPLSLDMDLSTMESGLRQQLNKYRFFLHPAQWAEGVMRTRGTCTSPGLRAGRSARLLSRIRPKAPTRGCSTRASSDSARKKELTST